MHCVTVASLGKFGATLSCLTFIICLFSAPIKSLRTSLPGELRLAPYALSLDWHTFPLSLLVIIQPECLQKAAFAWQCACQLAVPQTSLTVLCYDEQTKNLCFLQLIDSILKRAFMLAFAMQHQAGTVRLSCIVARHS